MEMYGNLKLFDKLYYAYRCEITHEGRCYKLWKEFGIVRRLEIFTPGEMLPEWAKRYIYFEELFQDLPPELVMSETWKFYNYPLEIN